jgi:hypothetical protein
MTADVAFVVVHVCVCLCVHEGGWQPGGLAASALLDKATGHTGSSIGIGIGVGIGSSSRDGRSRWQRTMRSPHVGAAQAGASGRRRLLLAATRRRRTATTA